MGKLRQRYLRTSLHESLHINRQRNTALLLIITGLVRSLSWLTLIVLYLAGVNFTKSLFTSVAFVAVISLYANAATDFGQVAASLAQLTAANVHYDVALARTELEVDIADMERDIAQLADLQPGPVAAALADSIQGRLIAERKKREHQELHG